jgi:carbamate kinase
VARLVIAFGGNALIREDERGTWPEQTVHALEAARAVARLGRADEVVLTHGNGPQVGALALQQASAEPQAPALPLDVLDAMTQGEIGYLLQQALTAVDPSLPTATVLTRVLVADDDPAFAGEPTKPIGPFYRAAEARRLARERGWHVAPDAGRGWRRMVPSPRPLRVLEVEQVRRLARDGVLVIAAGGGGIPVAWRDGRLVGMDAVVDKDRCAAELAVALEAQLLVLVTGVERVQIGFGTPAARAALRLTVSDALRHLEAGEFPAGSMGPKVESAARFVDTGGNAVITDAEHLAGAVRGQHGTWIVPDSDGPSKLAPAPVAASG